MTKQKKFFIGVDANGRCYLYHTKKLKELDLENGFWAWGPMRDDDYCRLLEGVDYKILGMKPGQYRAIRLGDVYESDLPLWRF